MADRFSKATASEPRKHSKSKKVKNADRLEVFRVLPKTKDDIVILGDSLTSPCEWGELFGDIRVKNRGLGGDTAKNMLSRLDSILSSQPAKIFIMVGTNDLHRTPIEAIIEDYKRIVEQIEVRSPNSEVYVQSVLPVSEDRETTGRNNESIIELNKRLNILASQYKLTYVNLFSLFAGNDNRLNPEYTTDGLHLNGKGYLVWKNALQGYIRPL